MNLEANYNFYDSFGGKTYRVVSQIGKGAFGVVYLVEEEPTKLKFALKVQKSITQ